METPRQADESSSDTLAIVHAYIVSDILRTKSVVLAADEPLIERGYLTSLATIELVMFIEERFDVEVDPDLVTEENFDTLRHIAQLVDHLRGATGEP